MRSSFAYLNIVSLLYTCSTTTTAESPIQRSHGGTLLKQRAPIEESSIDYGSLRTCKHKLVSRHIYTLPTKPSPFSSLPPRLHTSSALLLNFLTIAFPRPWSFFIFIYFYFLADSNSWFFVFLTKRIAYRGKFARRVEQRLLAWRWSIVLIIAWWGCVIMRMGRWFVVVRRLRWIRLYIRRKWLVQ